MLLNTGVSWRYTKFEI